MRRVRRALPLPLCAARSRCGSGRGRWPTRLRLKAQAVDLGELVSDPLGGRERGGYGALHGAGRVRWRAPAARVGVERVRGAGPGRVGEDARGELGLSCDVAGRAGGGRLVRARAAAVVAAGGEAVAGFVLITLCAMVSLRHGACCYCIIVGRV